MACQDDNSSSSMTPSEASDDDGSEHDSDYESDADEDSNVIWTGFGRKIPVVKFDADGVLQRKENTKALGRRYHMTFKMESDCRIVRSILTSHGFKEVHPAGEEFNIVWGGAQLKPFILRTMLDFQKVNHFPRSYEITRKDRLYRNIQRMQQTKGTKYFDFLSQSYILPADYQDFCATFTRDKGLWIVKPVASSRGRGVYLINHPEQIPVEDNIIVSRYINNPFLVDGFKFDVRLYVAVTSYDPIIIYLYEEGLTRFATIKYNKQPRFINHQCMHLTNYSVNKKNKDYVKNDDSEVEDFGNKWSFGALLRYLKSSGENTALLMSRIESVVIKTIIAAELPIATACRMFMPYRTNCFELYGFDILIDDNLKPWVLEVNLSPSLACDTPLDLKIKTNMLCDLFSLAGIVCHDPQQKHVPQKKNDVKGLTRKQKQQRPYSASAAVPVMLKTNADRSLSKITSGLNSEEIKILRRLKEEKDRSGGWVCIFPSPDSWDQYGNLLQFNTTHNFMIHQRLYPDRHKTIMTLYKPFGANQAAVRLKPKVGLGPTKSKVEQEEEAQNELQNRTQQYLRMLGEGQKKSRKRRKRRRRPMTAGDGEDLQDIDSLQHATLVEAESEEESCDLIPITEKKPVQPCQATVGVVSISQVPSKLRNNDFILRRSESHISEKNNETNIISSETYNPVKLLKNGSNLSKLQARRAFAMYLTRVQQRLIMDAVTYSNSGGGESTDVLNDQLELVLRFLKRAAVNLQQSFKIIVPSHKLVMSDRRRILAKQLSDFVHIYNKETEQYHSKKTPESFIASLRMKYLDNMKFSRFIATSSESELEDVLTTYTQIHKSASIFLGDSPTKHYEKVISPVTAKQPLNEHLQKKWVTPRVRQPISGTQTLKSKSNVEIDSCSKLEQVVSTKPADFYNEQAINDALQKLSTRQQARQYSAGNASNDVQMKNTYNNLRFRSHSANDVLKEGIVGYNALRSVGEMIAIDNSQKSSKHLVNEPLTLSAIKPPSGVGRKSSLLHNKDSNTVSSNKIVFTAPYEWITTTIDREDTQNPDRKSIHFSNPEAKTRDSASTLQVRKQNWHDQLKATETKSLCNYKQLTSQIYMPKKHEKLVSNRRTTSSSMKKFVNELLNERNKDRKLVDDKSDVPSPCLVSDAGGGGDDSTREREDTMMRHRRLMEQSKALLQMSRSKHEALLAQERGSVFLPHPPSKIVSQTPEPYS